MKKKMVILFYVEQSMGENEYAHIGQIREKIKTGKIIDLELRASLLAPGNLHKFANVAVACGKLCRIGGVFWTLPDIVEDSTVVARILRKEPFPESSVGLKFPLSYPLVAPDGLSDEQSSVFESVVNKKARLTYVGAKGGRGKSSTAKKVAAAFEKVLCLAPTHKALDNMRDWVESNISDISASGMVESEGTEYVFMTCHAFRYRWTKKYSGNFNTPPSAILMDELSMMSMWMIRQALEYGDVCEIPVLGTGDKGQLPNIGYGCPICDLELLVTPITLTKNFRAKGVELSNFADAIAEGRLEDVNSPDQVQLRLSCDTEGKAEEEIQSIFEKFHKGNRRLITNPFDDEYIQIIVPTNKLGKRYNEFAQRYFGTDQKRSFGNCFIGDPVVFKENTDMYKNGAVGILESIELSNGDEAERPAAKRQKNQQRVMHYRVLTAVIRMKNGTLTFVTNPDDILPAYAITVHKSQSTQYERVIVAIVENENKHHLLLSRQFLYTAVSRAKTFVSIIGRDHDVARCLENLVERKTVMPFVIQELDKEAM